MSNYIIDTMDSKDEKKPLIFKFFLKEYLYILDIPSL